MRRRISLFSLMSLFAAACLARAADQNGAFTDPAQAGPDFVIQGEYSGEVKTEEGAKQVGIQVIALGEGKFRAVSYIGGLPGDGWDMGKRTETDGAAEGGVAKFVGEGASAVIKDGTLIISNSGGQEIGQLKKKERESETLGAKPPEGAVVLFDGTSAENFAGGRITDDGLLMAGATSKQKFGSCSLHLEFRTPFQPQARGQARGNSGCYLQGRYEVQVLDSFGLEGKNNECGGIYSIQDPALNMCYPPLAWQTYDIDYTAATFDANGQKTKNAVMTVRHNGVVIHDGVELPHGTTAAPVAEGPEPGPLYLQDHGNPVVYRNIWLLEKK